MDSQVAARSLLCPQLITQAALEHRTLFRGDRDRFVYLALARRAAQRFSWRVFGYSLLHERTHLLLSAPCMEDLDSGVRWIRRSYSGFLRTDRGDRRRLWHSGYGIHAVEDRMLWRALACIEIEPARIGLAPCAERYLWSSAVAHLASSRPYLPLDDGRWQAEFGPMSWRNYLDRCPADFEYWRVMQWATAVDFTRSSRSQQTCGLGSFQSEPGAGLQARLGFGD